MNKQVIIIDDSLTVRKIVETSLRREGIDSISFASGIEAIHALVKQQDLIPDVVILDIGLPKMDGYAVAQYIRMKPQYKDTVIIILSGRDSVLDRLKGRLAGAEEYLTKPFTTQNMVAIVRQHLPISTLSA